MQKQHRVPQAVLQQFALSTVGLLLSVYPAMANSATPSPVIDTDPPTNITIDVPVASTTFLAPHPVITLDMVTQVASKVTATDSYNIASPSADFPGYPSGEIGPLAPGRHTITWTATDLGNNSYSVPQTIDVLPEVNFAVDQTVGEGNSNVTVTAYLSGEAPVYPVTINYTINAASTATVADGDHDATNGSIIINSPDTSGSISFQVFNDAIADPNETVIFDIDTGTLESDRVIAGSKTSHTVTISENNLAPIITISATQNGGGKTRTVITSDGVVTLNASIKDPNGDGVSNYDWSASDNALVPTSGTSGATFTFDPKGMTPGIYTARLTVRDDFATVAQRATSTRDFQIQILESAPTLSTTDDSDDDGVVDSVEGIGDSDNDGIPNYLDAVSNPSWLPGRSLLTYKAELKKSDSFIGGPITFDWKLDPVASNRVYYPLLLATEAGLKLSIGPTAFASDSDNSRIETASASLIFGSDLASGVVSADGQVVDVEIDDLGTTGQSVYLVIPQAAPIPPGSPLFKVMGADNSWSDFVNEGGGAGARNTLLFANKGSDNYCPPPGSGSYTAVAAADNNALNNGITCIEVLVEDGGPNDYDGKANGIIRLLGAPFITTSIKSSGGGGTTSSFDNSNSGSVEELNKISLSHGGGKIGFIGPWGVVGLLLAFALRQRQWLRQWNLIPPKRFIRRRSTQR